MSLAEVPHAAEDPWSRADRDLVLRTRYSGHGRAEGDYGTPSPRGRRCPGSDFWGFLSRLCRIARRHGRRRAVARWRWRPVACRRQLARQLPRELSRQLPRPRVLRATSLCRNRRRLRLGTLVVGLSLVGLSLGVPVAVSLLRLRAAGDQLGAGSVLQRSGRHAADDHRSPARSGFSERQVRALRRRRESAVAVGLGPVDSAASASVADTAIRVGVRERQRLTGALPASTGSGASEGASASSCWIHATSTLGLPQSISF